jgi:hypothetical protein
MKIIPKLLIILFIFTSTFTSAEVVVHKLSAF